MWRSATLHRYSRDGRGVLRGAQEDSRGPARRGDAGGAGGRRAERGAGRYWELRKKLLLLKVRRAEEDGEHSAAFALAGFGHGLGGAVADVGADQVLDHLVAGGGAVEGGVFGQEGVGGFDAADGAAGHLVGVVPAAGEDAGGHPGPGLG